MKFLILNGPNLNFLGIREPHIYGTQTMADLQKKIRAHAKSLGVKVQFYQSNCEGKLVDRIQKAYRQKIAGIVFNPATYTHTSVAIADAVKGVGIPTVEVHISDVNAREDFRKISYVGAVACRTIAGQGFDGYNQALSYLVNLQKEKG